MLLNAGQKYCRMLQGEHSAMLLTCIKLPFVTKIFVLSIFEWTFCTGFTVHVWQMNCIVLDPVVREYETAFSREFFDLIQSTCYSKIATLFFDYFLMMTSWPLMKLTVQFAVRQHRCLLRIYLNVSNIQNCSILLTNFYQNTWIKPCSGQIKK